MLTYNLQVIMGGAEVAFELEQMLDRPSWNKTWLQYCRLVGAPKDAILRDMTTFNEDGGDRAGGAGSNGRLPAYAYMRTKDPKYAKRAWAALLRRRADLYARRKVASSDSPVPVEEVPGVSTNSTAQWCLNAIEVLAMCGDQAPELG